MSRMKYGVIIVGFVVVVVASVVFMKLDRCSSVDKDKAISDFLDAMIIDLLILNVRTF